MPAAGEILTNSVVGKIRKYDLLRSPPRSKRSKHGKHRHHSRSEATSTSQPSITVLSKPDEKVLNGKSRRRFPDPSQDKHILLGIFDQNQTLIKLHYIDQNGIFMDDCLEKEILKNPFGVFYFVKFEHVQIDRPNCESEIKTEYYNESLISAKLSDHTIVDSCVPKEVAGYWIRTFGAKCSFTMNFTLWSAEVNINSSGKCLFNLKSNYLNEDFYNLKKLDDIHVQFENKPRQSSKKTKVSNASNSHLDKTAFDTNEFLSIISILRSLRDDGRVVDFESKFSELSKAAKAKGNVGEELVLILERSLFFCYQGHPSEGKRLLQKAVRLSTKCQISEAVKNRAYLFLTLIHLYDGNYGTAQECLAMVPEQVSSFMSLEDSIHRSMFHGMIMLNFGQKIRNMSQSLWQEADDNFERALELSAKLSHPNNDLICTIHLWLGKLHIEMLKLLCTPGCKMPDLEVKILEQIQVYENLKAIGISKRVEMFGLLVKGEYAKALEKTTQVSEIVEKINILIGADNRLYFHEITMLQELERNKKYSQKKHGALDVIMLSKTRDILACSGSDSGYTADNSSSNEQIDLAKVRYEQTTYV
eukprot:gene7024-7812_t